MLVGDRLQEMWNIIKPYVGHTSSCTFGRDTPDGEFCNCGYGEAKKRLRELKKLADNEVVSQ